MPIMRLEYEAKNKEGDTRGYETRNPPARRIVLPLGRGFSTASTPESSRASKREWRNTMMLSELVEKLDHLLECDGDMPVRVENWPNKHMRVPVVVHGVRGAKPKADRRVSRGGVQVCLLSAE